MKPIAVRLSTYALMNLGAHAPHTLHAMDNWLDQCGFWLADLATHPSTPEQVEFMIGYLGLSVSRETDWPLKEACVVIAQHYNLYRIRQEAL